MLNCLHKLMKVKIRVPHGVWVYGEYVRMGRTMRLKSGILCTESTVWLTRKFSPPTYLDGAQFAFAAWKWEMGNGTVSSEVVHRTKGYQILPRTAFNFHVVSPLGTARSPCTV